MEVSEEIDESRDGDMKTAVFQVEIHEASTARREQMAETDNILKSLSPLINSMRPFGLYFTRKARINCETTMERNARCVGKREDWNFARIYATVLLVITWLNAFRSSAVFDGKETQGAELFLKFSTVSFTSLYILNYTAYYMASHRGSLDRVIRHASSSMAKHSPKYGRLTRMMAAASWLAYAWNFCHYIYQLFSKGSLRPNDLIFTLLKGIQPQSSLYIITVLFVALQMQAIATWTFPQAMHSLSYTLCSILFGVNFYFAVDKAGQQICRKLQHIS